MTRTEFLGFLNKRLQVLKQQERDDILNEYEQHIVMRMEKGLSEEEAIKDFGDLEELVCEILDAYNVDPDYGKKQVRIDTEKLGRQVSESVSGAASRTGKSISSLWGRIRRFFSSKAEKIKGLRNREKHERKPAVRVRKTGEWGKGAGNFMKRLGKLIIVCIVFCWKAAVVLFLSPFFAGTLFALLTLGILAVLLFMGYPLWGLTVMNIGLIICGVSLIWLIGDMVFGKKEEKGHEN